MVHHRIRIFGAAIAVLAVLAGPLRAQEPSAPTDEQVGQRLAYIESALSSARPAARTWRIAWISAFSAATVVQWSLAGAHWNDTKPADGSPDARRVRDREFAEDMLVGGATTALGLGGMLIDPFVPARGGGALKGLPEATPEQRRVKLLRAEEILRLCAAREKRGRSLTTHLLNLGVNAAAGIVTAAAFRRPWTDGLVTFAAGEAVSLLNIFTQPRRAIRDLAAYEAMVQGKGGAVSAAPPAKSLGVSLSPAGISLSFRF